MQAAERLLGRKGRDESLRQGDWCKDVARVEWDVMVAWTHGHPERQRRRQTLSWGSMWNAAGGGAELSTYCVLTPVPQQNFLALSSRRFGHLGSSDGHTDISRPPDTVRQCHVQTWTRSRDISEAEATVLSSGPGGGSGIREAEMSSVAWAGSVCRPGLGSLAPPWLLASSLGLSFLLCQVR